MPTAGVPYRPMPVVTRVVFETTAGPNTAPAEKYAAQLMARTVGLLDKVDVGALVAAYLEDLDSRLDPDRLEDYDALGDEILHVVALVETVLDQCRSAVRTGLAADLATTLIPRLKGHRSV